MLRTALVAGLLAITAGSFTASAIAAEPAPAATAPAAAYSTATTDIGTLLDNPATKAVLAKHVPQLIADNQIEMARSMTLKQVQGYASDMVTDDVLAKIDADLAKIPANK